MFLEHDSEYILTVRAIGTKGSEYDELAHDHRGAAVTEHVLGLRTWQVGEEGHCEWQRKRRRGGNENAKERGPSNVREADD